MRRTAILLAGLALTGCGGYDDPSAAPATAPATATTPSTTPSTVPSTVPTTTGPTASSSCGPQAPLPAGATLVTATVSGSTVTTANHTWRVKVGSAVRIAVTADRADEVHVHSYDKKQDTVPGCPTAIDLTASIPGTVEVELENAGLHLFDLKAG